MFTVFLEAGGSVTVLKAPNQAHLDKAVRELQVIRMETIARSTNVISRLVAEVDQELTPEQKKAFEAMRPKSEEITLNLLNVKPPKDSKP